MKGIINYESKNLVIYCTKIKEVHEKLKDIDPTLINRKHTIIFQNNEKPHILENMIQKFTDIVIRFYPIHHI